MNVYPGETKQQYLPFSSRSIRNKRATNSAGISALPALFCLLSLYVVVLPWSLRFGAVEVNRLPRAAATRRPGCRSDCADLLEELTMCRGGDGSCASPWLSLITSTANPRTDSPRANTLTDQCRAQMSVSGDLAASYCLDGQPYHREEERKETSGRNARQGVQRLLRFGAVEVNRPPRVAATRRPGCQLP